MSYTKIRLQLTDEQLAAIDAAVNLDIPNYGILAQPYNTGDKRGQLLVYILTPDQYKAINGGIAVAYDLPAYLK